jgi:antitoxin VapB
MSDHRRVRLFRSGGRQTVQIPPEFELPGDQAVLRRDGARLVLGPVRKRGLIALLATMRPLDLDFPEIDDLPPT